MVHLVREFYANAVNTEEITDFILVRGRRAAFDSKTISALYELPPW